jgi:hypothetical protein
MGALKQLAHGLSTVGRHAVARVSLDQLRACSPAQTRLL